MGKAKTLTEFVTDIEYDDLPDQAVQKAKQCIRAYFACALYGSQDNPGERVMNYVNQTHTGEQATVIGHGTANGSGAALANGVAGIGDGCDDTFASILIHPSAPILSGALAAAEVTGKGGRELLTGYTLGVEATFRIGHSVYPSHYESWHGTNTIGTFGSAMAAASIFDLTQEETKSALGIAASSSAGLKKNMSPLHYFHAGRAAQAGLQSAQLAKEGFTSADEIIGGEQGYGSIFSDQYQPDEITDDLSETWGVTDIAIKIFPCAVITHSPVEALYKIIQREDIGLNDVEIITVTLDEHVSNLFVDECPPPEHGARRSAEFCLAALIREHTLLPEQFTTEYIQAEETRRIMDSISIEYVSDLFNSGLGAGSSGHGAKVVVETKDGNTYTGKQPRVPGWPDHPISEERLVETFYLWAEMFLTEGEAKRVKVLVDQIEDEGSLDKILSILRME